MPILELLLGTPYHTKQSSVHRYCTRLKTLHQTQFTSIIYDFNHKVMVKNRICHEWPALSFILVLLETLVMPQY